jgi:hypothetical protein
MRERWYKICVNGIRIDVVVMVVVRRHGRWWMIVFVVDFGTKLGSCFLV